MNILVIEDDPIHAKLAREVLGFEGHSVQDVEAAEWAIPEIQRSKPDLIVIDLLLPGVDGLTFARQLKHNPETQDIAIIAVTAANYWSRQEVLDAGCDAFLIKPIGTQMLCTQVSELGQKRIRA